MEPMRMHRSEFHVNLIPPGQLLTKTPKNSNVHILISNCVSVGPIVVLSTNNFIYLILHLLLKVNIPFGSLIVVLHVIK